MCSPSHLSARRPAGVLRPRPWLVGFEAALLTDLSACNSQKPPGGTTVESLAQDAELRRLQPREFPSVQCGKSGPREGQGDKTAPSQMGRPRLLCAVPDYASQKPPGPRSCELRLRSGEGQAWWGR